VECCHLHSFSGAMMRGAARIQPRAAAAVNAQKRGFNFPPAIAITGMPLQSNTTSAVPSYINWEARVAPRSRAAEAKFGFIGSRVDLDKCEHPGLHKYDKIEYNTYEGGSYVARNDLIAGPENEYVFEEWPNTEKKYREMNLLPREPDEYKRRVQHYAIMGVTRATYLVFFKSMAIRAALSLQGGHDMKALSTAEFDIGWLDEGQITVAMWNGKPTFIYHRTPESIAKAKAESGAGMRDPQTDEERHSNPKYAIMLAICSHLGCVPIYGDGNWGAFLCPCHGSHYDHSGRCRLGPAPTNLEVPPMTWLDEKTVLVGKAAD